MTNEATKLIKESRAYAAGLLKKLEVPESDKLEGLIAIAYMDGKLAEVREQMGDAA